MQDSKCTLWNNLQEKEMAGKIFWFVQAAVNAKKYQIGIENIAKNLNMDLGVALQLYQKYSQYQNEPVTCKETLFKSKIPYMSEKRLAEVTGNI